MKLTVRHQTLFRYSAPASHAVNQVCLLPRNTSTQTCTARRLTVEPEPAQIDYLTDHFGNHIGRFSIEEPHTECRITAETRIDTQLPDDVIVATRPVQNSHAALIEQHDEASLLAHECLLGSRFVPMGDEANVLLDELPVGAHTAHSYAFALMQYIHSGFNYDSEFSTLVTPISDILVARRGVCQDFAHLAIATLRRASIPARYVSGYLETMPPPGGKKLQGADASHAWFSVFDVDAGWRDFDPTNGKQPDTQYITTAWGRDYADVSPMKGTVYGGGKHRLSVAVDVGRLELV